METPRSDSGSGLLLLNNGDKKVEAIDFRKSVFFTNKDARKIDLMKIGEKQSIIVVSQSAEPDIFTLNDH